VDARAVAVVTLAALITACQEGGGGWREQTFSGIIKKDSLCNHHSFTATEDGTLIVKLLDLTCTPAPVGVIVSVVTPCQGCLGPQELTSGGSLTVGQSLMVNWHATVWDIEVCAATPVNITTDWYCTYTIHASQ
jgi:hypothetical protein